MADLVTENARTLQAYNAQADRYAAALRPTPGADLQRWFARLLDDLPRDASILEIGSATGRDATFIEALGYRVQRSDACVAFVDQLRAQGHDVWLLDVLADDLGGPYDLVFANAVFPHFTDDDARLALKAIRAALRPGGTVGFTVKRGEGSEWSNVKLGVPRFFNYWDVAGIRRLLADSGYVDCEVTVDVAPDGCEWVHAIGRTISREPPDNWELANWIGGLLRERFGFDELDVHLDWLDNEATVTVWDGDDEIVDIGVTDIPRLRARREQKRHDVIRGMRCACRCHDGDGWKHVGPCVCERS
jgi:SAM-dependent methyltransferase